ncbi:TPA: transposase [Escherichia coli]|nr:transposase [Escherichia coli]
MSGKRYPEEFKIEAVKQVVDRGYSVASVATRLDITTHSLYSWIKKYGPDSSTNKEQSDAQAEIRRLQKVNRPGFPGECFICELRLPDHRFRWKHNKLFLLLPVGYGPAFPAIVDCYTSPPT